MARYCLDAAVVTFGIVIENALLETEDVQVGKHKEHRHLYTLDRLLDQGFFLPRPKTGMQRRIEGASNLVSLTADPRSGVKLWKEAG